MIRSPFVSVAYLKSQVSEIATHTLSTKRLKLYRISQALHSYNGVPPAAPRVLWTKLIGPLRRRTTSRILATLHATGP